MKTTYKFESFVFDDDCDDCEQCALVKECDSSQWMKWGFYCMDRKGVWKKDNMPTEADREFAKELIHGVQPGKAVEE
jgi:hypothetical protein